MLRDVLSEQILLRPQGERPRGREATPCRPQRSVEEAASQPHDVHDVSVARAGAVFREVPLPGCLRPRAAGAQDQAAGSESSGEQRTKFNILGGVPEYSGWVNS